MCDALMRSPMGSGAAFGGGGEGAVAVAVAGAVAEGAGGATRSGCGWAEGSVKSAQAAVQGSQSSSRTVRMGGSITTIFRPRLARQGKAGKDEAAHAPGTLHRRRSGQPPLGAKAPGPRRLRGDRR